MLVQPELVAVGVQASLHLSLGQPELAEPLCQRALDIRTRLLGATHAETAAAMAALSDAVRGLGR